MAADSVAASQAIRTARVTGASSTGRSTLLVPCRTVSCSWWRTPTPTSPNPRSTPWSSVVRTVGLRARRPRRGTRRRPRSSSCTMRPGRSRRFALFGDVVMTVREGADGAVPGVRPVDTIKQVERGRGGPSHARPRASCGRCRHLRRSGRPLLRQAHRSGERGHRRRGAGRGDRGARWWSWWAICRTSRSPTRPTCAYADQLLVGQVASDADGRPSRSGFRRARVQRRLATASLVLGGVDFVGERGLAGPQRRRRGRPRVRRRAARCGRARRHRRSCSPTPIPPSPTPTRSICCETSCGRVRARRAGRSATSTARWYANARRIAPRRAEMESRLTEVVGAAVSVKASTAEKLGALGRGEGIACLGRGGAHAMTPSKSRGPKSRPGRAAPSKGGSSAVAPASRPVTVRPGSPGRPNRRTATRTAGSVASRSRGARRFASCSLAGNRTRARGTRRRPIRTTSSCCRTSSISRSDAGAPVREISRKRLFADAHTESPQGVIARRHRLPEHDLDDLIVPNGRRDALPRRASTV